ncbi:MAG: PEP-CTERM sorting domain-containing protein [Candidatus Marinimicrobia bacterium]|nr:PEP-CTERM sorting domain-containing protein [Candidatus Neomarinimicrobiota bacterium]
MKKMHAGLILAGLFTLNTAVLSQAATIYWGGGENGVWHEASNWSLRIPEFRDVVTSASGAPGEWPVDIQANAVVGRILQSNWSGETIFGKTGNPFGVSLTFGGASNAAVTRNLGNMTFNVNLAHTYDAGITDFTWSYGAQGATTVNGDVSLGSYNWNVTKTANGYADTTVNGTISGSGGLILGNSSASLATRMFLTDENTYTGATTLNNNTHLILNGGTLGNANITIGGGAIEQDAWLAGDAVNKGTVRLNIANDTADLITLANAYGRLQLTNLNLELNFTGTQSLGTYILADYSANTVNGLDGIAFNQVTGADGWSIDYAYNEGTQIALVIPEPGALALFGVAGLLLAAWRRTTGSRA